VSPSTYAQGHADPVSGSGFEVLGSDPAQHDRGPGDRPGRSIPWLRVAVAVGTVAALVLGGVGGAVWERDRETQHQAVEAQGILAVSAVVTVGVVPSRPRSDGSDVVQRVDLAVVSAGPAPLDDVVVSWDATHVALAPGESGRSAVGALAPHDPRRVQMTLRRPCAAPAPPGAFAIPRLVVTAKTQDGRSRRLVVDPLGLDQTWTAMQAACPDNDVTTETTVTLVEAKEVGRRRAVFTLSFTNHAETDVLISGVILAKGFNTSDPQPAQIQVFPRFSGLLAVSLTITSCRTAIEDVGPTTIRYVVASADDPSLQRPIAVSDPKYSAALGHLLTQCLS
jgi:hypothetical protein